MTLKHYPNLILIAGTGRNVGKTLLACQIISHLAKDYDVIGVKISPHFHTVGQEQRIVKEADGYRVIEEMLLTNKDSSRMKQAGASKVFYIQSKNEHLLDAFNAINDEIDRKMVVCESGGLHNYIQPAKFILVKGDDIPENKANYLKYNPIIIKHNEGEFYPKFRESFLPNN